MMAEHNRRKAMRKFVSSVIAASFVIAAAGSAFAQTPAPKGPQDCKANEQWDATTKTCVMKK